MDQAPAIPKRNSGRTGWRRLSEAEAILRGPKAAEDWRRRNGRGLPALTPQQQQIPAAPVWFTPVHVALWKAALVAAPYGLLQPADYANLVALVVATELHQRLCRAVVAEGEGVPDEALQRALKRAAGELGRASRLLGLTPLERAKLPAPPAPEPEPQNPHMRYDVVQPNGRRTLYRDRSKSKAVGPIRPCSSRAASRTADN